LVIDIAHRYAYYLGEINPEEKMATNLAIDTKLIEEARRLGGHTTRKAVVMEALLEYIQRRKQLEILKLFGQIEYDRDYDYKAQRRKK